jgi:hypothetical protein
MFLAQTSFVFRTQRECASSSIRKQRRIRMSEPEQFIGVREL